MATKRFVYVKKAATLTSALQTTYANSIVFIEDTNQIFTHGKFFGINASELADLKKQINAIKSFSVVSNGTTTAAAPAVNSTLTIKGTGGTTVTVNEKGVTINSHVAPTFATGTTSGTLKLNGTDYKVKDIDTAAYHPETYFAKATDLEEANGAIAKVVKSVSSGSASISIMGTSTDPTVGLLINSETGNVTLTETAEKGLSANINLPVTGVAANDKVLSMTDTTVSSTISMTYDSTKKVLNLYGKDTATPISTVSCNDFITDGVLESVTYIKDASDKKTNDASNTESTAYPYLKFTWNAAAGNKIVRIPLDNLVDKFDGKGILLSANYASATAWALPAIGDSMDTAIGKLAKDVQVAKDSGVTSFGGKTGAITLNSGSTTSKTVNFAMDGNKLTGTVYGVADSTQGGKADSALQSITASSTTATYITASASAKANNTQTISVGAKTLALDSASSTADGLATAYDAKTYIDKQWEWEEL